MPYAIPVGIMGVNIFSFNDYRSFLLAYAHVMKEKNPRWSFGAWARRLELKTTSSLTKILQGDRNPGAEITDKFVKYFRFSEQETEYFRDLIRLEKIKHDGRLVSLLVEKMKKEYPTASPTASTDAVPEST